MPEPDKKPPINPEQTLEQPTREITQTDRINKQLLTSLFKRMDEAGDSTQSKMLEDDNKIEDDEWED